MCWLVCLQRLYRSATRYSYNETTSEVTLEMIRGICPIIVLYFAINVLCLTPKTVVGQQGYKFYHNIIII